MARKEPTDRKTLATPTKTTKVKRKRRITTVNDILARDDVNDILESLVKNKAGISDLFVITIGRDGEIFWRYSDNTLPSKAIMMLEVAKFDILSEDSDG